MALAWRLGEEYQVYDFPLGGMAPLLLTAVWAAWDSSRIDIRRYKTQLANDPFMVPS